MDVSRHVPLPLRQVFQAVCSYESPNPHHPQQRNPRPNSPLHPPAPHLPRQAPKPANPPPPNLPSSSNQHPNLASTQPTHQRPLPVPYPSITFEQACQRYALAAYLRIPRSRLGDELRDEIWLYVYSLPALRNDEFAMVVELLAFDGGLVRLACQRLRGRRREAEELMGMVRVAEAMLEGRKERRGGDC
ncbi:hypothetical protein M409DRAFT_59338 [Zasmidium cellare ATCC 36951]|uniref:Uncharacterized protein n=1 Tax=Zasmidium cellare ATCC 36951 TaxID=1080233 RepID=A0A6A6C1W6_ZASCE|nr:uncharacterized protein M409DRAFT_59338 [Zasmidium cellare ATCC 36951]KAF2161057.1 hypothetical protein M409DRAFT_59338 [Zasmidium cellare ATCC 36951]